MKSSASQPQALHMLILKKDQELFEEIIKYCNTHNIDGAQITGIGALSHVELGYYELGTKTYHRKNFGEQEFELLSLQGNISEKDGDRFAHMHASLGDEDYKCWGGHLFTAKVAVTAEVFLQEIDVKPVREHDDSIGLHLICRFQQA